MSAAPRLFYLRTKVFGADGFRRSMYLCHVSDDGLTARFDPEPRRAYAFNDLMRAEFIDKHGHIGGRWVLMRNELARRKAEGLE